MESDIYGNTALPLAPDLQSLQTPHICMGVYAYVCMRETEAYEERDKEFSSI